MAQLDFGTSVITSLQHDVERLMLAYPFASSTEKKFYSADGRMVRSVCLGQKMVNLSGKLIMRIKVEFILSAFH